MPNNIAFMSFDTDGRPVTSLDSNRSGSQIVSIGGGESLRLWDTSTRRALWSSNQKDYIPTQAKFSVDNAAILVASTIYENGIVIDHSVYEMSTSNGTKRWEKRLGPMSSIVLISPCGRFAILDGVNGLEIAQVDRKNQAVVGTGISVSLGVFSRDGNLYAARDGDHIELVEVAVGKKKIIYEKCEDVLSVSSERVIVANGHTVVAFDHDGGKRWESLETGSFCIDNCDNQIIVVSENGKVTVLEGGCGKRLYQVHVRTKGIIKAVSHVATTNQLVVGGGEVSSFPTGDGYLIASSLRMR